MNRFTLIAHSFLTLWRKKICLNSLDRSFKTLSESHEFQPILFKNSGTVISQSTVNIVFFERWNHSTLIAYNFLTLCCIQLQLVSSGRAFKIPSESYEFQPILFRNGGTVIYQTTVHIDFFERWNYSTLIAYNFFTLCCIQLQLISSERAFKTLSESHEFQPISFKNSGTVISQSTVNIVFLSNGTIQFNFDCL